MNNIFKITGKVQHYAWGGLQFIPNFLHQTNAENKPCAEYWLGAHPSAPSAINETKNLLELIQENPTAVLGERVYHQFKELPYLFKILDVKDMLSIQVHPSKIEAEKGFDAEEVAGIAINASNRNYKDRNHKPEVMVALSEFWLLHGFKVISDIEKTLEDILEFNVLFPLFRKEGLKSLYQFLMEMPQEQVDTILLPLVKKEISNYRSNILSKKQPGWWTAKLYNEATELKNLDRGIFSIYLFNIVGLQKGEAIFQGAGIPHAYLEGQNVELMANSDNVLRGGLTPKHIDVPELMKHTLFEPIIPQPIKVEKLGKEKIYPCPVPDFGISAIELEAGERFNGISTSLEILLILEGAFLVKGIENTIFKSGEAVAISNKTSYEITATGKTLIYKAFVP